MQRCDPLLFSPTTVASCILSSNLVFPSSFPKPFSLVFLACRFLSEAIGPASSTSIVSARKIKNPFPLSYKRSLSSLFEVRALTASFMFLGCPIAGMEYAHEQPLPCCVMLFWMDGLNIQFLSFCSPLVADWHLFFPGPKNGLTSLWLPIRYSCSRREREKKSFWISQDLFC